MSRSAMAALICMFTGAFAWVPPIAQDEEEEVRTGWFNTTELSAVVIDGNAKSQALGFKNLLRRRGTSSRIRLRVETTQIESADDRFAVVDPASVLPGVPLDQQDFDVILVEPPLEPDVDKALIEARYDRDITETFFWNVGAGWDRNDDAGIVARYQVFGGVGNVWWERDDLGFETVYALSYNNVEEAAADPEKDDEFLGARFEWHYFNKLGKTTEYRNDWSINLNTNDLNDFWYDMVNSIRVAMSDHLALQVSLQWLYQNRPALEDIDVVLYTDGNGNAIFPCAGDCFETAFGKTQIRKKQLDTVFNASLVVDF